jgi:signal transduction histidine kinase
VNTARSTFARIGVGVFSAVLGAVLLVMIGALFVADQTLSRNNSAHARLNASAATVAMQQQLSAQLQSLSAMRGAFLTPRAESPTSVALLARDVVLGTPSPRRLLVVDSTGAVVYDTTLIGPARSSADVELSALSATAVMRGQPTVVLSSDRTSPRSLLFVTPLTLGGHVHGAAAASYSPELLFAPILQRARAVGASLVLRTDRDTVVAANLGPQRLSDADRYSVTLPTGGEWVLEVRHTVDSRNIRVALWVLGFVALLFLGTGVIRERRQAIRISERSAELERLSTELLRANRMKSEFLANVSHELRTPLNAIVGFVDLLREGVYGELAPRQVPPVDRIAASATHLRHLVDQVLDIAKIAAGRLDVHSETIALRPFVLNVASELESLISERELTLSIAVGATLPRVRTDPSHLRQILVNLIGNAVKYTPAGGVAVRARLVNTTARGAPRSSPEDPTLAAKSPDPGKSWVALQVIDTGIGIAPADQERIFDEFEQVNAGPRGDSMQRGTGLGLAISRRLARLLGGDLTVESQLGKGSTFTVWIPVSMSDLDGASAEQGGVEQRETAAHGDD